MDEKVRLFLEKHRFAQPDICSLSKEIFLDMENGLSKQSLSEKTADQPMLVASNTIPEGLEKNSATIVIDAGGTNFRSCLVKVDNRGQTSIENLVKTKMPGVDRELSKDEFYDAIAENLDHLKNQAERISFCFSYAMEMTLDGDGKILVFSKEVKAPSAVGTYVGRELKKALERKGWTSIKKIVLLNDTTASLLAGIAAEDKKNKYSSYIGFILGTGMNNAYIEYGPIGKIDLENCDGDRPLVSKENVFVGDRPHVSHVLNENTSNGDRPLKLQKAKTLSATGNSRHIVVCECGMFGKLQQSDFDVELDTSSNNPGTSKLEKMCSGAYLGKLSYLVLNKACKENLFSAEFENTFSQISALTPYDMDIFLKIVLENSDSAAYFNPDNITVKKLSDETKKSLSESVLGKCVLSETDGFTVPTFSEKTAEKDIKTAAVLLLQVYERAARIVSAVLSASILKTEKGTSKEAPVCIVANGSTFWKAFGFYSLVQELLNQTLSKKNNSLRYYQIVQIENDITLGTLAAAFM